MEIRGTLEQAIYEYCPSSFIIASWCFLTLIVIIDLTIPVLFGYLTESHHLPLFGGVATGLYYFDKLGVLLLGFCLLSTYIEIARAKRFFPFQ
jgi:hypothetical protein